ncbi:hypothetical protein HGRIS_006046 [Hohenbuehelia grisea]|uniref:Glycoside hydrolase family 71 protein n=1 Tax=Hohenbuehelia grisea TaxID=104357 RepID=A0ABR3K0P9_9AGAR
MIFTFIALCALAAETCALPIRHSQSITLKHRHQHFPRQLDSPAIPRTITLIPSPSATSSTTSLPISTPSSSIASTPLSSTSSPSTSAPSSSMSSPSTPSPSPQPPSSGSRKYVVAHHMVGNTFPYTKQDWADDVALAHASGIDGFALNYGRDEWQPARIDDAYEAARNSGLDFKMFLSLDMTSLPCDSPQAAEALRSLVSKYISHPNQLQYDSRAFVSTFAGETCTFGQGSVPQAWETQFARHPDLQGKIYFVPAFFVDPAKFGDFKNVIDGDFNWNSGWPVELTTSFASSLLQKVGVTDLSNAPARLTNLVSSGPVNDLSSQLEAQLTQFIGSTESDKQHLEGLKSLGDAPLAPRDEALASPPKGRAYMAAVSPWFFTHYGADSFAKNFMYLTDQHLYSRRWESLISSRDQFDIVQVLTWNDYGESHYIGPIKGAQPNSQAWVDGFDHTGWLEMTGYYATAFKTGAFPAIEKDRIYMWARSHPTRAQAPDPVGPPSNFELAQDAVWAVVMATAPSTVTLSTSDTNTRTFNVPAGVTKLSIPISAGDTMQGSISRDGKVVVELKPESFSFQGSPKIYNFNAFVASASAS